MQNTLMPARVGKSLKLPLLWALCAFAGLVQAQGYTVPGSERARPRSLVDHSRIDFLAGRPQQVFECQAGTVLSGGACITLSSLSAGATVLPGNLPGGTYTNSARYPLALTLMPNGGGCYGGEIYVSGRMVARAGDDCEWSLTSAQAIIPAGASFSVSLSNMYTVVTAMSANANWRDTGIRFPASYSAWVQVYETRWMFQSRYDENGNDVGSMQWVRLGTFEGTRNVFDQYGVFMYVESNPYAFLPPDPCAPYGCGD